MKKLLLILALGILSVGPVYGQPIQSREQLVRAIDESWDVYEGQLRQGLIDLGYDVSRGWGIARAEEMIGLDVTAQWYAEHRARQDSLNGLYGQYVDAPYMRQAAHDEYDRSVHNAESAVAAARFTYEQTKRHNDRIRRGDFGFDLNAEEQQREDVQRAAVDRATVNLGTVRQNATAKRDTLLRELDNIRPGVQQPVPVVLKAGAPVPDDKVSQEKPVGNRKGIILGGMRTYTGPLNKNGLPRIRPLREHIGLDDLSKRERNALWPLR